MARLTIDQLGKVRAVIAALEGLTPAEMGELGEQLAERDDGLADQVADVIMTELLAKAAAETCTDDVPRAKCEGDAEGWALA